MVMDQGDELHENGDYIKRTAAEAVNDGQAVTIDSNGQVALADAATADRTDGIVWKGGAAGDDVTVYAGNAPVVAAVESDTAAGDGVGAAATTGDDTAGNLSADGSTQYVALEAASSDYNGDAANAALVKRD